MTPEPTKAPPAAKKAPEAILYTFDLLHLDGEAPGR
jgi:hypothetical protein